MIFESLNAPPPPPGEGALDFDMGRGVRRKEQIFWQKQGLKSYNFQEILS